MGGCAHTCWLGSPRAAVLWGALGALQCVSCPGLVPCLSQAVQVVSLTVLSQLPLSPVGKGGSLSACLSPTLLSRQAPD